MKNKIHQETCHVCGFICSANNLSRHIKKQHGEKEYIIYKEYLDKRLQQIKDKKHNETLKRNKKHINCPYCDRIEISIKLMKNHIKNNHKEFFNDYVLDVEKQIQDEKIKHKQKSLKNSKTNYTCEFCGELFPSKQLPSHIKHKHGMNSYLIFKENMKLKRKEHLDKNKIKIVCPICNQQFDGLLKHIFYKHNMKKQEFKKLYPNVKLFNDKRQKQNIICKECGKHFDYNNSYMYHLKKYHLDQYEKIKSNNKQKFKKYECQICRFKTNQIYQHIIESHNNISWEEYCLKYKHDQKQKKYFSKEHRQKLSQKALSHNISNHSNTSYYFSFQEECEFPKIIRSLEQFKIISILIDKHINFDYEKDLITWTDNNNFEHHYVVDITIDNEFYEIKGLSDKKINNVKKEEKYIKVDEILKSKNKKLNFINFKSFLEKFNIKEKEYKEQFFIKKIKDLIDKNKLKIFYHQKNNRQSRLFQKIDKNYKNNKNLIIV